MIIKYRFRRATRSLQQRSRQAIEKLGIDGRTNYFAGLVQQRDPIRAIRAWTGLSTTRVVRLLEQFLTRRFVDFAERQQAGLKSDIPGLIHILSQGYKRGLRWRELPLGKTCFDICIYQQMIQDLKPRTIIEFGTGFGASTLFLADTCRGFGLHPNIITLDINADDVSDALLADELIEFIAGDVSDLRKLLPDERLQSLPHPWLIIEDCHKEIPLIVEHLYPHMAVGDYFIIEDIGHFPAGPTEIARALEKISPASLMVDTHYTDLFGVNSTCSPDSIFKKVA